MSRFHSYLATAFRLIDAYQKGKPFAHQLKTFFSSEKKYGSRDRKIISSLCYQYFRTSHLLAHISDNEEKMIRAVFLCENEQNDFLAYIKPEWNLKIQIPLEEKLEWLKLTAENTFPFRNELSAEIDAINFSASFIRQPKVFARIRPGKTADVLKKLHQEGIEFDRPEENALGFSKNISLDTLFQLNRDIVIQDLSSQKVYDFVQLKHLIDNSQMIDVWDCCAASGGKSILFYDISGKKLRLTVTDIRKSILLNLRQRLGEAGVPVYKTFAHNLADSSGLSLGDNYDVVICDAPCTGSGTWSRNPEQLYSFDVNTIDKYVDLQRSIVSNVIPHLKENGYLIYITCSVFAKENEEMVSYIRSKSDLNLIEMKYIKGYTDGADTMFAALFRK